MISKFATAWPDLPAASLVPGGRYRFEAARARIRPRNGFSCRPPI